MTEDAHDRLDLAILRQLQADGRATCEAIGERIGLSASAVLRRIKKLEDNATIDRLLDGGRIGIEVNEETGWQYQPEQTTSALICHHPRAKYFVAR